MTTTTNNGVAAQVRAQVGVTTPYTLQVPIKLKDGTELSVIHLRRPTGREMRNMAISSKMTLGVILDLVGSTSGLMPEEIDSLDGADVFAIAEIFAPFLERAPGATA